jgi:hypothetical protein
LRDGFDYNLHEGDVFRLGKVEYKIVEMSGGGHAAFSPEPIESNKIATLGINGEPSANLRTVKTVEKKVGPGEEACRVCFDDR